MYWLLLPIGLFTLYQFYKSHSAHSAHEALYEEARLNRMRLLNRITDDDRHVWH